MIRIKKSRFVASIIATVVATALIMCGIGYGLMTFGGVTLVNKKEYTENEKIAEKYEKLYKLQTLIENTYLWDVDEDEQMDNVYKALVDSLGDKYSAYYNVKETKKLTEYLSGTFAGVGIVFSQSKEDPTRYNVGRVIEDSPADSAGIKAGDVITAVDGKKYSDSEKIVAALRGELGSRVKVTFERDGEIKTAKLVRGTIEDPSVGATVINKKYGYILISSFDKGTEKQFEEALNKMENKNLKGVIIDLRGNGGGVAEAGINIADMLLPEAVITKTVDKNGKEQVYNSDGECTKMKYVVLVNGDSASTSEILAGAIKENNGGALVGTKTFGKGIIQTMEILKDQSSIKLTTMEYLSPKGKHIHNKGITPDYVVKQPKNSKTDLQLKKAISLLK
ncbi:MAG: S41 family peptidase [Clostridia bacterium]|nr:S41 family peptidase [Clostridia bacterium]